MALGERTVVMGILNVTPDSFSDGGRFTSVKRAVRHAMRMMREGADVIDVGGESTRPGAAAVDAGEEQRRVIAVVRAIVKERADAVVSIDTYRADTARMAVEAGAEIVNDVSGFLWDPKMAAECARMKCGVVLMHTRGRPSEWSAMGRLKSAEVVPLVVGDLREAAAGAVAAGVERGRIVLDPGLGFGKIYDENYPLLAGMSEVVGLGFPVLAGVSRKAFLGRTLAALNNGEDMPVDGRLVATTAANVAAILGGAHILRVHDVRTAVEACAIADAVLGAG